MLNLPINLPRTYKYQFRVNLFAGSWRYYFELIGARGGLSLHISGPHKFDGEEHWSAGLEYHSRLPLYDRDAPPDHDECWLLKCPCWHDGTSLYAQEEYLPRVLIGDYAGVFHRLAMDADAKFKITCEGENS